MPKRADINSVLVIGSGPIVIGQACEFDYSGTQACRVLRAEGNRGEWADEFTYAVTPRIFKAWGINVDLRIDNWENPTAGNVEPDAIVIKLRYRMDAGGNGYHYDLVRSV